MTNTFRIKRRAAGGAAGAPASLAAAELAFNEQDKTLYYGSGNSGGAATVIYAIAGPGSSISAGDTAPSAPLANSLWFDSVGARLYIWYNDGTSSQWVGV